VLRNVFISQYRRDSSRPALATAEELDRFEDGSARQPHEIAEGRLVYKAIAELPPNFRDAIVAVDVAGLKYRDAARSLGVAEATLTSRLFRARNRVAKALGPREAGAGKVFEDACVLVADPTSDRKDVT
jgi:RNA polymerase sigma-70 factor, ECF subfamily